MSLLRCSTNTRLEITKNSATWQKTCHGARFSRETLAVTWRGKSIGDVLKMEVDEPVEYFKSMPSIRHPLQLLKDVGLCYLTIG